MRRLPIPLYCILFCLGSNASLPSYDHILSMTDHTSVSPASSLETWGYEVGLMGGELPRAQLVGRVTIPYAFTFEVSGFPQTTISGVSVSQIGAAVQWTFTDKVWMTNFANMAVKAKYAHSDVSDNPSVAVYGLNFLISRVFGVIEPYLSVGQLSSSVGRTSEQGALGVNVYPTPFVDFGAEYSRAFGVDSLTGKLALQFD